MLKIFTHYKIYTGCCPALLFYPADEGEKHVDEGLRGSREHRERVACVFTGSKLRTSYGLYSWYSLSSLDTLYESSRNTAQPNNKAAFLEMATYKRVEMSHINVCTEGVTLGPFHV